MFALLTGVAAAAACSSFSEEDVPPDAGADDASPDADVAQDASPSPADASADGAPIIRWSFEDSGTASTGVLGDGFVSYADAGYGPGIVGGALHCPRGAYALSVASGTPFEIGTGDATFVFWASIDPSSEMDAAADRLHTFFDRHTNWAASGNPTTNSGYGIGYVHAPPSRSFLQASVNDGTTFSFVAGTFDLGEGQFHMVAFVVDQKTLTLYADGRFVNQAPITRPLPIGNGPDAGPIRLCDLFSNPLRGSLDELMIFPRALGPTEIAQLKVDVEGK